MKPEADAYSASIGSACSSQSVDDADAMTSSDDSEPSDGSSACSSQSTSPVKLDPPAVQQQQPRLPGLSLSLGGLARTEEALPSSRGGSGARPPIPRLGLRLPGASNLGDVPPPTSRRPDPAEPQPEPARTATLAVDLLSRAFSVVEARDAAAVQQQCADRLGVAPRSLQYYALVGAASLAELPPNCARVAVEVSGSRFSLEAMEELLRENRELAAAAAAGGTAGDVPEQRSLKEQLAASKQIARVAQARVAKLEGALQQEQAANKELQEEMVVLRRQLKRSEELRQRGQRALDELKHEFEALQRELVFDAAVPAQPAGAVFSTPAPMAVSPVAGTPGAAAAPQQPDRLADLLGKLCESTTLDKLEQVLTRLQT